jgi:uncharacterized protein YndB with AHSA1/START domain
MLAKPSLTLRRHLKAPPSVVYAAWTDPEKLVRWFGPAESEVLRADADPKVGGSFRVNFRTSDGEEHEVSGMYREVQPDNRLVFTWAWRSTPERQSVVTVALKPEPEGTVLTLTHDQFFDEAARDRHRSGWTGALDNLERYLATLHTGPTG